MSKHRLEPPPQVRPRVGRMVAATVALAVTGVAMLSGMGLINLDGGPVQANAARAAGTPTNPASGIGSAPAEADAAAPKAPAVPSSTPLPSSTPTKAAKKVEAPSSTAVPVSSGNGRRVVFSISDQRVWLVSAKNATVSTYLVSGSVTDNLKPGRYDVYSRSRWAVGIDDSGVMQYFVRFTHGKNAPIGFHSIPTKNGKALQTESQLGTPQSHGCIRQRLQDAVRMWDFAQEGTDVVVVA
ncbi:lipoprotein-anchoring transpeptidase ErfK/SrfK [Marmoricola sp. OAE513]|uniref:L,D-transpeptidase n=1 Tax=Marmoricola sp. OAE513 TaxID=2817894 RepID=UPI001AE7DBAA